MPSRVHSQSVQSKHSLSCDSVLVFKYVHADTPYLHFFIGKQYGGAIKRNLLKRRIRYLYRLLVKKLGSSVFGLSVFPIKKNISYNELERCFALLESKLS